MNKKEKLPPEFAPLCEPYSPIELMLAIMNDDGMPIQLRADMAKHAAPYVHHRLTAVESVAPPPRYGMDLDKLSTEELIALERMMAKAQMPLPVEDDPDAEEDPDAEKLTDGEVIARAIESRRR